MGGESKVRKDFPKINTNSHDAEISPPQTPHPYYRSRNSCSLYDEIPCACTRQNKNMTFMETAGVFCVLCLKQSHPKMFLVLKEKVIKMLAIKIIPGTHLNSISSS